MDAAVTLVLVHSAKNLAVFNDKEKGVCAFVGN